MKGTHPPKRVNPLPMITNHGDFQPCFDKTDVKKRDTNHLSDCIGHFGLTKLPHGCR